MSILDLIPSGQERTAAKQKAEQFLDEKARYFLGPQGYNLASGIVNIPQYLLSAVDIRDYYKSGADLTEKLSKGQFDQSTLESGLDTLGSAAGILIPGVTYRGVKEGFGFLNPFRKNEDVTRRIDFDLKDEISEEELSDTVFYRGESKGRSSEGFGEKDDIPKLVYLSKDPEHAGEYATDFSAGTVDDSGKAVLDYGENTQIYKTRVPKDLNLFTYDNPEHIALATSWGKKNQNALRGRFQSDKRGRKPFDIWLKKLRIGNFDAIEVPEFTDFLRKQGFDGHYTAELYRGKDGPKYATNVAIYNPGNVISEFDPRITKQRVSGGEDFVPDIRGKVDNMFDSMGEEGAMMEYPQIGESLDDYIYNVNRDALRKAEGSEDYPNYLNVLRSNLQQVFPSGKIPVRRTEGYSDVEKKTRQVNEFTVDLEDVKFVGNKDERELIMKVDRDKFPDYPHEYMSVRIADDVKIKTEAEDFKDRRYHFSLGDVDQNSIKKFSMEVLEEKRALRDVDPDLKDTFIRGNENIDLLGLHVGPLKEAQNRQSALSRDFRTRLNIAKNEFPEKIVEVDLGDGDVVTKVKGDPYDDLDGLTGSTYYPLQVNLSKPFTNPNSADGVWEDFELAAEIQKRKNQDLISNVEKNEGLDRALEVDREQIKKVRRELAEEGYTNIPYVYGNQFAPRKNRTANSEEISQIMLIDQPKNKTVIKSSITGEPMAEGGLVSLTHVARDMFRGPQGISAFEQFIAKPQRPMVS